MSNGLDPDQDQHYADHDSGGSSEGPPDPLPAPVLKYRMKMK